MEQEHKWIVLQVITGKEMDVKWAIDESCRRLKEFGDLITETIAPVRNIAVHSTKSIVTEPVIKSYLFVKCNLTNRLWQFLRWLPNVYGILQGNVTEKEMQKILPLFQNMAELRIPDAEVLNSIKQKYSEFIETKRSKKTVFRLPLELYRSFMKSAKVLITGAITENKLIRLIIEPVRLAI